MATAQQDDEPLDLLRQQNDTSIIFRLPIELLCNISLLAIWEARRHHTQYLCSSKPWNWFQIAQLCHRWRVLALDYPSLWSVIEVHNHEARNELIKRSKPSPINIYVDVDQQYFWNSRETVAAEMHRIRKLRCRGESIVMKRLFETILNTPAPILERFEVHSHASIPTTIFTAPHLRKLALHSVEVDWHLPLFRNLKTFSCENGAFKPPSGRSDIYNMLTVLAPTLEILDLSDLSGILPQATRRSATHPPAFGRATMPYLTSLSLRGDIISCSYFMSHIVPVHPLKLKLLFDIEKIEQLDTALSWVTRNMELQLKNDSAGGITHITICRGDRDRLLSFQFKSDLQMLITFEVELQGDDDEQNSLGDAILIAVHNTCPLPRVNSLSLGFCPSRMDVWAQAYGHMREVELVTLNQQFKSTSGFFSALIIDNNLGKLGGQREVLMPKLREVVVVGVDFREQTVEGQEPTFYYEVIIRAVSARKGAGIPLERLVIRDCRQVTDEGLRELRDHVAIVEWDGVQGYAPYNLSNDHEEDEDD